MDNGPQTIRQLAEAWAAHNGVTEHSKIPKLIHHTRAWVTRMVKSLELEQDGTAMDEYDSKMYCLAPPTATD